MPAASFTECKRLATYTVATIAGERWTKSTKRGTNAMLHRLDKDDDGDTGCDGCNGRKAGWFWCARVGARYVKAFLCPACVDKVRDTSESGR